MRVLCLRTREFWALSSHGSRSVLLSLVLFQRQALSTYPLVAPVSCCPTGHSHLTAQVSPSLKKRLALRDRTKPTKLTCLVDATSRILPVDTCSAWCRWISPRVLISWYTHTVVNCIAIVSRCFLGRALNARWILISLRDAAW